MYNFGNKRMVTNGLVLCVDPMNPKSYGANIYDLSGKEHNITLNTVTHNNNKFIFDATNNGYVRILDSNFLTPTSSISFGCYIKCDWATTSNFRFVSKTQGGGYQIGLNEGTYYNNFGVLININNVYSTLTHSNITTGWHYNMNTYDGQTFKLYFDGKLIKSIGVVGNIRYAISNSLLLGAEPANYLDVAAGSYLTGEIGLVQLYNRALTEAEVLQNFNSIKNRYNIK